MYIKVLPKLNTRLNQCLKPYNFNLEIKYFESKFMFECKLFKLMIYVKFLY